MIATHVSSHLVIAADDPIGPVARQLIAELCSELSARYGTPPSPFSPSEAATPRSAFLVARLDGEPVGCGAIRRIDDHTADVKRMYVAPAGRRRGIARSVLVELERRAEAFAYRAIRLETGIGQPEAIALYEACGYRRIGPYGSYVGNPSSVCFEKFLNHRDAARVLEGTGS
ncbi:MAG: GNAT family N-acetyltransferase [Verrucomicrobiales bacterium]|nr:GNAT family N-acetyltransferase [Verrucomicrobiales bacterium]